MADLPELANPATFARIARFKPSYVHQLKNDGRLVLAEDGKQIRVRESLDRIEETKSPEKAAVAARHAAARGEGVNAPGLSPQAPTGGAGAQDDPRVGNSYQAARAVRERYLAMEAKRAYEHAIGKLLEAAHVEAALADAVTTLRTQLEGLPDILASDLAAEPDEARCRALITDAVEQQLHELARQFQRITQAPQERAA